MSWRQKYSKVKKLFLKICFGSNISLLSRRLLFRRTFLLTCYVKVLEIKEFKANFINFEWYENVRRYREDNLMYIQVSFYTLVIIGCVMRTCLHRK